MKTEWPDEVKEILSVGVPLTEIGVENWALMKVQALQALDKLEEIKVAILGGDVLSVKNNRIQYNYDNWYCNIEEHESDEDFIIRSLDVARKYICNYQCQGEEIVFAFVPKFFL